MKKNLFLSVIVIAILRFGFLTLNSFAQPGFLDPTFDYDGKVITTVGSAGGAGASVAIQSDGKIVVSGVSINGSDYDIALVRYNSDGSLDNSFDSDGIVTTDFEGSDDWGNSVAIQSDGKIVVAGFSDNGSDYDFALVRYNTTGSLDSAFNSDGKITTPLGSFDDQCYSVVIQNDGKIVLAGYSANGSDYDFALVRYNSDGTLDNGFDSDGIVTTDFGSSNNYGISVAIQNDDKILLAGWSIYGISLIRYNSDGSLDNTFGTDGIVTTAVGSSGDNIYSVAVQSDGKIVVAGASSNDYYWDLLLVRYDSTGSLDTTFDSDGIVTTDFGSSDDWGRSVAIQSDGKIVVAGHSNVVSDFDSDFALVRYTSTGSLDNTFGYYGIMTTDFGNADDGGHSVAIQSDGKIVVAGVSDNGSNADLVVARYVSENLDIGEMTNSGSIQISPNPCHGIFQLSFGELSPNSNVIIEVYNNPGKLVYREKLLHLSQFVQKQISLKNLSSGIYILNLKINDLAYRKKLIIQN